MEIGLAIKIMPDLERVCELEEKRFFCNADETINTISTYSMRKQIPVKPRLIDGHLIGEKYWWQCGACGASMHTNTRHHYCHYCGQRVDWTEVLCKSEHFVPKDLLEKASRPFPELKEDEAEAEEALAKMGGE